MGKLWRAAKLRMALLSAAAGVVCAAPAFAQQQTQVFGIPAQNTASALNEFSRQAGVQILFPYEVAQRFSAPAVEGAFTREEALRRLIAGTGLSVASDDGRTIVLSAAQEKPTQSADDAARRGAESDVLVVTGSRVRGAQQASPLVTITEDQMRQQGHTDVGQALRALPQNFNGGQNPGIGLSAGNNNQNISGGSGFSLRGLGADATLTLLNGVRMPYDGYSQATDAAAVPVAAIERVEVLLDGASAIYGSDAVGGVANILLKRDYNGAEISARWGAATQGGFEQQQLTGVAGATWTTGGFIVTADHNRNTSITADQRDYLSYLPPDTHVFPSSKQQGAVLSAHQQLWRGAELSIDAFYTRRTGQDVYNLSTYTGFALDVRRDAIVWGVAPALRFDLAGDWSLRLGGVLGQDEATSNTNTFIPSTGTVLANTRQCYCNDTESVSLDTEGPLFNLPGGVARIALGGGYRGNELANINRDTGLRIGGGEDSSYFAYGEMFLPLISDGQAIPLVHALSLTGAVRYEDYDSFGDTTTPKLGVIWAPTPDIDFRVSWGRSFKVPTLHQQFSQVRLDLGPAAALGGTGFPAGSLDLFLQGGNPNLTPERAETFAAGFVLHPEFLPGFRLEANWFDIDYTDRVSVAFNPISRALSDPAGFPFVTFNPSVDQQNAAFALAGLPVGTFSSPAPLVYDPALTVAIVDARFVNTASQHAEGVDLAASYSFDLFGGVFTANGAATWLTSKLELTSLSAEATKTGFVFNPADFRARVGGSWASGGLTVTATGNWTDGVINDLVPGRPEGDGFGTVDLVVDYVFEHGPLGGSLGVTLGVQNLFDEDPPYMQPVLPISLNYDSTNYSAMGRVVNLTVRQRF